jgi:hypothetical protein
MCKEVGLRSMVYERCLLYVEKLVLIGASQNRKMLTDKVLN